MKTIYPYDVAVIIASLLQGDPNGKPHKISTGYIEFENNGGADVEIPTLRREDGIDYYNDLATHPTRDYLRVPIEATKLENDNPLIYKEGNRPIFFLQTSGAVGVHGKQFSIAQQSRVYGIAMVATPDFDDPTQDLVFMRGYYDDANEQIIKTSAVQIGIKSQTPFS